MHGVFNANEVAMGNKKLNTWFHYGYLFDKYQNCILPLTILRMGFVGVNLIFSFFLSMKTILNVLVRGAGGDRFEVSNTIQRPNLRSNIIVNCMKWLTSATPSAWPYAYRSCQYLVRFKCALSFVIAVALYTVLCVSSWNAWKASNWIHDYTQCWTVKISIFSYATQWNSNILSV